MLWSREVVQWVKANSDKLLAGVSLIPILIIALYISLNGVNVPFFDEWDSNLPIAIKAASGTFVPRDLLTQHGEERFVFTHLVTAILTYTTHWNIKVGSFVSLALAVANWLLLLSLVRRQQPRIVTSLALPLSLLMFSIRQRQSWLMSFEMSRFFVLLFFLAALWVLARYPVGWQALAVAALLSLCSTFSYAPGLLVWPVLLMTLWMLGYRKWYYLLFWLIAAAVGLGLFFTVANYKVITPSTIDTPLGLLSNNFILGRYVAAYLGGPLVPEQPYFVILGGWVGVAGVALLLINLLYLWSRDHQLRPLAIWSALGAFALATALLQALGRVPLMLESSAQPLSTRYVNTSTPLWVAVVVVSVLNMRRLSTVGERQWWEKALAQTNLVALVLMACLYLVANYDEAQKPPFVTQEQKACMLAYPSTRNATCLEGLYPAPEQITDRILSLADYRLSAFAEPPAPDLCAARDGGLSFDVQDTSLWRIENMQPATTGSPDTWIVAADPQLDYEQPLDAQLSDYAYLYVQMAVTPDIGSSTVQIYYSVDDKQEFSEDQSTELSVIPDGAMHEYFFALDELGLPASTRLTDIRLDPVLNGTSDGESWVQVEDFRLLGDEDVSSQCPS